MKTKSQGSRSWKPKETIPKGGSYEMITWSRAEREAYMGEAVHWSLNLEIPICNKVDGIGDPCGKWNKPATETNSAYFLHMWKLRELMIDRQAHDRLKCVVAIFFTI